MFMLATLVLPEATKRCWRNLVLLDCSQWRLGSAKECGPVDKDDQKRLAVLGL